jgi:hypothetical protein
MKRILLPVVVATAWAAGQGSPRFLPDDPLLVEPRPMDAGKPLKRKLSDYYDFVSSTFLSAGEQHPRGGHIPAQAVNTLGEPMDSAWWVRRHYYSALSIDELRRGVDGTRPPVMDGAWTVIGAKSEGITPGFTIRDAKGETYFIKFDPVTNPEIATSADVISARFFHALGYHVPDNYLVRFQPAILQLGKDVMIVDERGRERPMTEYDLRSILERVPRLPDGRIRAVASRRVPGTPVGPFRFWGQRTDDPNDIVPHEHRRDLRGLSVFDAWLAHDDSRAINTFDAVVEEDGVRYIKHYLMDFGSTLGSASTGPNSVRSGFEYVYDFDAAKKQFLTFGFMPPKWAFAKYQYFPSIGYIEWQYFDPENWVPEYRNPAFENRLPDDAFWAAKQVTVFTNDEIRAIVRMGEYSDPAAEEYMVRALIERRDKIGRAFFARVLPLDKFGVHDGRLTFVDVSDKYELVKQRELEVVWGEYDNHTQRTSVIPGAAGFTLPGAVRVAPPGKYFSANIRQRGDADRTVTVYLRTTERSPKVVGIDRTWKKK